MRSLELHNMRFFVQLKYSVFRFPFRKWYVSFYRVGNYSGPELDSCGRKDRPCYHLQTVFDQLHGGEEVILTNGVNERSVGELKSTSFLLPPEKLYPTF